MKYTTCAALAAALATGACSHGASRHFSMGGIATPAAQTTESMPASNPSTDGIEAAPTPQSAPTPHAQPDNPPGHPHADDRPTHPGDHDGQRGTLAQTSGGVTQVAGRVLYLGGNVVLGAGGHGGPVGGLLTHTGEHVRDLGKDLKRNGVGGLPLVGGTAQHAINGVDNSLNGAAHVRVVGLTAIGAATPATTPALGVAALSGQNTSGTLASANLLNQGAQQPASLNLAGVQVLGQSGTPAAVGVSALPNIPALDSIANVNVGLQQGAQLANVSLAGTQVLGQSGTPAVVQAGLLNNTPITPVVQGAVGAVGGVVGGATQAVGGVLSGATQTTGGLVGGLFGH